MRKAGTGMDKLKILVVDDESRMRKLVKDFLTKSGYEVLEAGDGEEAVDLFYKEKDIALIILDVMMPKMDGWQVCREIRQYSKIPIIMLTAKRSMLSSTAWSSAPTVTAQARQQVQAPIPAPTVTVRAM